jgi:predicted DNA-binding transcriptional regulator AlpA
MNRKLTQPEISTAIEPSTILLAQADAPKRAHTEPPELLTLALIRKFYLPFSERAIWRWISAGQFPRPDMSMGAKIRMWRRSTVERWIDARAAEGAARCMLRVGTSWAVEAAPIGQ